MYLVSFFRRKRTFLKKKNKRLKKKEKKKKKFKITHWNINGTKARLNNSDHMKNYINKENFDIICLNETKMTLENIKK